MQVKTSLGRLSIHATLQPFLFSVFSAIGTDRSLAFPTKDRWEECPLISAYFGCNVTVGNLFHSASHNCSNRPDYSFFLYISLQDRDIELNPVQSVGVNANSSICRVSAVADLRDVAVGRHNLRFLSYNHLDNYTVPKICTDSMDVRGIYNLLIALACFICHYNNNNYIYLHL